MVTKRTTVTKSGMKQTSTSKIGTKYKSKRFPINTCDRCGCKAVISTFRESEYGNPVCTEYDCEHGGKHIGSYVLKERKAKKPRRK